MAKRKAVGFLTDELGLSERRSCRIVGLARSVQQYRPIEGRDTAAIDRLQELAAEYRRYGYLRLHALLRREGLVVNRKRTWRLYREEGLQVRTKKRRKLPRRDRIAPQVPERAMQRWSLDFMSDQLADYRRFRILNLLDDHSRVCPGQIVDLSITGARLARFLDDLALSACLRRSGWTTVRKAPAGRCSTGRSVAASGCASSSWANRVNRRSNLTPDRRPILTPISNGHGGLPDRPGA